MSVRKQYEELGAQLRDAQKDGKIDLREYGRIVKEGCEVLAAALEGVTGDDAAFAALVADTKWAVETYIVPIDIPGIGPIVEGFIDPNIVAAVEPVLTAIRLRPPVVPGGGSDFDVT